MGHFLVNICLTLSSTLGLSLSSISQDHIRALDTSARSDEPSSVSNAPLQRRMYLDTIGASACTSSQAVVTSSSRHILRPYPLPRDITTSTSLTNSSSESNGGYRAAAYYVNWVSYTKTTMLTSLTTVRQHMVEITSHTIFPLRISPTSSMRSQASARTMVRYLSLIRMPIRKSTLLPTHGPSLTRV